jgi:hypothetical protein
MGCMKGKWEKADLYVVLSETFEHLKFLVIKFPFVPK